jgi:hypothetical protein
MTLLYKMRRIPSSKSPPLPLQYATTISEHLLHLRHVEGMSGLYVGHTVVDQGNGSYRDEWPIYQGGDKADPADPLVAVITITRQA